MSRGDVIARLWQDFERSRARIDFHGGLATLTVLADALTEAGYKRLADDLSRFVKRLAKSPLGWALPRRERAEWARLVRRVIIAAAELRAPMIVWPPHARPQTTAMVRFHHPINPRFDDVAGPYPIRREDVVEDADVRAWFKRVRKENLGRARIRQERGRVLIMLPRGGVYAVEIGRRGPNLPAREIAHMAERLKQRAYAEPLRYARRLYREGVRWKGRWIEEPGPLGHLQGGGLGRDGRRYVRGLEERLFAPGELEESHGFRRVR